MSAHKGYRQVATQRLTPRVLSISKQIGDRHRQHSESKGDFEDTCY